MASELQHVGILGMRWGQRRSPEQRLKDAQKKYDKKKSSVHISIEAYNRAADHANNVLIPKINKKYSKYDFSKLKLDSHGRPTKDNPELQKVYDKYLKEYSNSFKKVYDQKIIDLIGERPS